MKNCPVPNHESIQGKQRNSSILFLGYYDGGDWLTRALAALPLERKLAPIDEAGWSPELAEVLEKEKSLFSTRIQSPDHPACSQVLYFSI